MKSEEPISRQGNCSTASATKMNPDRLRRRFALRGLLVLLCTVAPFAPASASDTIAYSYDARGRLVSVARAGGVNNGMTACYAYDKADNRTNVTVSTSACSVAPAPTPSFSISDSSALEGSAIQFTITRTGPLSGTDSVKYATGTDGTATSGVDYTAVPLTQIVFNPNIETQTITVATSQDSTVEANETFHVNLSSASAGTTISDAQATGTILDDDCTGVVFSSTGGPAVTEGANAEFTIARTGFSGGSCAVNYRTLDDSALTGSDYIAQSGTLTFAPGQTSQLVSVATVDDTIAENAEDFSVQLTSATAGATIGTAVGSVTINDNDATSGPASFSINNVTLDEGSTFEFTVTKAGSNSSNITVNWATANGTATNLDYTPASGTLVFGPNDVTKTVDVQTKLDSNPEGNETFYVNLSGTGVTFTDPQGVGTITDQCSTSALSSPSGGAVNVSSQDPAATSGSTIQSVPIC